MVAILIMSAKLATLDLPKIKKFESKDYDVTKFYHLTQNYIVDVVM